MQNIAKAQAEIDRLESKGSTSPAPASDTGPAVSKPANRNESTNGIASATAEQPEEKDAAADVSEGLKNATLEDEQAPEREQKEDDTMDQDQASAEEENLDDEKTEST